MGHSRGRWWGRGVGCGGLAMGRTGHPLASAGPSTLALTMSASSSHTAGTAREASAMTFTPPRPSVTIVLPAYNEAHRIGPALDELFGWLDRGGPPRALGRSSDELGSGMSWSSTTGPTTTPWPSSKAEPRPRTRVRARAAPRRVCASCADRTEARVRRSRRVSSRPEATSSSSPTPTWPPRPTRSTVDRGSLAV